METKTTVSSPTRALTGMGLPVAAGVAAGLVAASLAVLETRWIVFPCAAVIAGAVVLVVPDKKKLLTALFVMSLQINVALRLFYGRAGSDGIAIFLPVLTGLALLAYRFGGKNPPHPFRFAGRLAVPIALIFATDFLSMLWTHERFVGVTKCLLDAELYLMYCVVLNVVRSEQDFERIIQLLLLTLGMQSVVYLVQSTLGFTFTFTGEVIGTGDIPRPGGTVSTNPAGFASFLTPLLFIAVARFMTARSRLGATYLLSLIALGLIAIVITFTRAAWGAVVLGGAVLLLLGQRRGYSNIRRLVIPALAGLLAVMLYYSTIQERLANSPLRAAYEERVALMDMALNTIAAHPLVGLGPGAYSHDYKTYLSVDLANQWKYTVHNEFLLRTAETGIPGGVAFILLLILAWRMAYRLVDVEQRHISTFALSWSAALPALAFHMYWVPWTGFAYNAILWFFMGLTSAATALVGGEKGRTERARGGPDPLPAPLQGSGCTDCSTGGLIAPVTNSSAPMSYAGPKGLAWPSKSVVVEAINCPLSFAIVSAGNRCRLAALGTAGSTSKGGVPHPSPSPLPAPNHCPALPAA